MACVVEGNVTRTNPVFHIFEAGEQAAEVLWTRSPGGRTPSQSCFSPPPSFVIGWPTCHIMLVRLRYLMQMASVSCPTPFLILPLSSWQVFTLAAGLGAAGDRA